MAAVKGEVGMPLPVCYPADHHQVHDEVNNPIPVAHHNGIG